MDGWMQVSSVLPKLPEHPFMQEEGENKRKREKREEERRGEERRGEGRENQYLLNYLLTLEMAAP